MPKETFDVLLKESWTSMQHWSKIFYKNRNYKQKNLNYIGEKRPKRFPIRVILKNTFQSGEGIHSTQRMIKLLVEKISSHDSFTQFRF